MTRCIAPVVGLLLATACATGGPSSVARSVRLPATGSAYALPTESCGGHFIVQAWINGRGPYPLVLDSGAGRTHLDPRVLRAAAPDGRVESFRIGDFEAFDFGAHPLEMTELSAALGREIMGIVGHGVFRGTLMTWDFQHRRITLRDDTLPASGPGIVRGRDDRRPWIASVVQGDTLWILLDTGSDRGLTLRSPERFRYLSPPITSGAVMRVDGVHLVRTGRIEGEARLGPIRVVEPVVANSVSVDLVGQEVLRHFVLTFDQRTRRVRFVRPDAPLDDPVGSPPVEYTGFALRPRPDWADVIHVSEARAEEGVRLGDRVVSIDGVPWRERGCRSLDRAVRPRMLELRVQRGDSLMDLHVPVIPLHPRGR